MTTPKPEWYSTWLQDKSKCPVTVWREDAGLSRLAMAQLIGISTTTMADQEAGRRPSLHGALLRVVLEEERGWLESAYREWYAGLSQEIREKAEAFARFAAPYGGGVDGGADDHNLAALRDLAQGHRRQSGG